MNVATDYVLPGGRRVNVSARALPVSGYARATQRALSRAERDSHPDLTRLASVIRRLGHLPSLAEYEVQRTLNPLLPSASALRTRHGGWKVALQLAQRLGQDEPLDVPQLRAAVPDTLSHADPRDLQQVAAYADDLAREHAYAYRQVAFELPTEARSELRRLIDITQTGAALAHHLDVLARLPRVDPEVQREHHAALEAALNEARELRDHIADLQRQASDAVPVTRREYLDLIRQRDELRDRLNRLSTPSRQEDLEDVATGRERLRLLEHFRRRLHERFGVRVTYPEVQLIDEEAARQPTHSYMSNGTPVRLLTIQNNEVYALMTPDQHGRLAVTTAYTAEMARRSGFLPD